MQNSDYWIAHLQLVPHPEGGFFREVYRSTEDLAAEALPARFGGRRSIATSIIYLLRSGERSVFHRIKSDETWHFYSGAPLELFWLDEKAPGQAGRIVLGPQVHQGEHLQWTVPAGVWFASRPLDTDRGDYSLLGCTVSPGFDFSDFEIADQKSLLKLFPASSVLVTCLTLNSADRD